MRGECILRPTISGVVNDLQIIKLLELLKTKTTESPYSLAKCLCTIKAVFSKPYFPTTVFGKRKTVSFDFSGMSYIVEFTACAEAHSQDIRSMDVDNPVTQHNNHIGISQPIIMASSNNNGSSSSNNNANIISTQPPQFIKPSIDYILENDQMVQYSRTKFGNPLLQWRLCSPASNQSWSHLASRNGSFQTG